MADVEGRLSFLEERLDSTIIALGYVRETAEANGEEKRTLRQDVADLRGSVESVSEDLGKVLAEVSEMRKLLGRWPASPDDTGSGIAGRVALVSAHDIDPKSPSSSVPPAALVVLWKKHRKAAALVSLLLALLAAALESGAVRLGEPPAAPPKESAP